MGNKDRETVTNRWGHIHRLMETLGKTDGDTQIDGDTRRDMRDMDR